MGKRNNRKKHGGKSQALILLEYVGVRCMAFVLGLCGRRGLYVIGAAVGRLVYVFDVKHRKLALKQISESFPEMPPAEVRRTARQAVETAILTALETVIAPKYIKPGTLRNYVDIIDEERFAPYLETSDHGPLLVTGHYGNWEIGGYTLACLGHEGVVLARPLDNPLLNNYIKSMRNLERLRTVDKKGGVRAACRAIREGQFAGFIADQYAGTKGIFVDFFGRPASTVGSIAMIALRFDVPILVCLVRRLGRCFRFEFSVPCVITPDQWKDKSDPELWITQEFTRHLEEMIRREPGQYFGWLHKRWRPRPVEPSEAAGGQASRPPFGASDSM